MRDKLLKISYLVALLCFIFGLTIMTEYTNTLIVVGIIVLVVTVLAEIISRKISK